MFSGKLKPYEIYLLLLLYDLEARTTITSVYEKILLEISNDKFRYKK